jgi:alpha-aminoadipic semialdehyde synthase
MMAVDILPASVPLDASRHFSKALEPYLAALIEEESGGHTHSNTTKEIPHQAALTRATIASAGVLAPKHSWLQYAVDQVDKAPPAATAGSEPSSVADSDVNTSDAVSSSVASSKPARRVKKKILMLGSGMVAQPAVDMIALNEGVELVIGKLYIYILSISCSFF